MWIKIKRWQQRWNKDDVISGIFLWLFFHQNFQERIQIPEYMVAHTYCIMRLFVRHLVMFTTGNAGPFVFSCPTAVSQDYFCDAQPCFVMVSRDTAGSHTADWPAVGTHRNISHEWSGGAITACSSFITVHYRNGESVTLILST
jgi:hypothetical protein